MTLSEVSYSMNAACYHLRRHLCCCATSMEKCGFARVWRLWSVFDRPSIWTILCGCRKICNAGVMDRDKEQRKSRILEMLRLLQLDSIRDKLVRDLSHPQQIMLQWEIVFVFIARIALEVQSNRRVILLDNAFEDFSPADYGIVCLLVS